VVKRGFYFALLIVFSFLAGISLLGLLLSAAVAYVAYRDLIPDRGEYLYNSVLYFLFLTLSLLLVIFTEQIDICLSS